MPKLWHETRRLTTDLLESLDGHQLHEKLPRPGLNTFAVHFMELGDVEDAYANAMRTSELDFSHVRNSEENSSEKSLTKKDVLEHLNRADGNLLSVIERWAQVPDEVSFGEAKVDKNEFFNLLRIHETFHQGQMLMFCYLLGVRVPKSWLDAWAVPAQKSSPQTTEANLQ